jgi:cell wall-associated NlpC family hydrolase
VSSLVPSARALADIPAGTLQLYRAAAAACPGLPWTVLAAIGAVESDHGRSSLPGVHSGSNSAGAQGMMQFLPATFARYAYPVPPGGHTPPSPYDPTDAVFAASRMLCADGAADTADLPEAVWDYNHSSAYVTRVLTQAALYTTQATTPGTGSATTPGPNTVGTPAQSPTATRAALAVTYARRRIGVPYQWGGNGPDAGQGFDCSGLTAAAYRAAGITLPRTAQTQYDTGPKLPTGDPITPGDLVFFGTSPTTITHVGIALLATQMIDAPATGTPVRLDPIPSAHLVGATRPAATHPDDNTTGHR